MLVQDLNHLTNILEEKKLGHDFKQKKMIYYVKCINHVYFNSHTLLLSFHDGVDSFLDYDDVVMYVVLSYKTSL